MSIKKLTVAAIAALGLTLGAYSASAGPVSEGAALPAAKAPSTFTLVFGHGGGGGGHGGGGGMGFGGGMGHGGMGFSGSMGHSFGSMGHSYGGMGMMHGPGVGHFTAAGWPVTVSTAAAQLSITVTAAIGAMGTSSRSMALACGIMAMAMGGSCYWNCRAAGYGPGFCSVNAYDFCY